ncbi:MAG: hypothetical protein Kapaf2KO_01880 [Candidatus Kapaibacteriales bacterium]
MLSQNLNVFNINPSDYPTVSASFILTDEFNQQVKVLDVSEFEVFEDGIERDVISVECPPAQGKKNVSAIIAIDISGSMEGQRLIEAKNAALSLVQLIEDRGGSEASLLVFANESLILNDFSKDFDDIRASISALFAFGGTNYDKAFLDPTSGIASLATRAEFETHVFFLTDGLGKATPSEIILSASQRDIIVHSIAFNIELPDVLRNISNNTGGLTYSNLETVEQLRKAYSTIFEFAVNSEKCTIMWTTQGCVSDRNVVIRYLPSGASDSNVYVATEAQLSSYFYPLTNFAIFQNDGQSIQIPVRADNGDIELTDILVSDTRFIIKNPNISDPIFIPEGSSISIDIEYNSGGDNSIVSSEIELVGSSCRNNTIYATAGEPGTVPSGEGLRLTEPVGGEIYLSGQDTLISWKGVLPTDEVKLEFSDDDGGTWREIDPDATGLKINYKYPDIVSDECRVRVSQTTDIVGKKIYGIPDTNYQALDLSWDRSGRRIAMAFNDGTLGIFNSLNGDEVQRYKITDSLNSVDYAPDGIRVAVASPSGIFVVNTISSRVDTFLLSPTREISDIKYDDSGNRMAIASLDSNMTLYDSRNWTLIDSIFFTDGRATSVEWSPDNEKIAVATNNINAFIIDLLDFQNPEIIAVTDLNRRDVTGLSWSPDGSKLAASTNQRRSRIFDVTTLQRLNEYQHHTVALLKDVAWSPNGDKIVTIAEDSRSIVYDPSIQDNDDAVIYDFPLPYAFNHVEWSPTGDRFAVSLSNALDGESLIVYSVDQFTLQEDISNKFSLVMPELVLKDIDFGNVDVGIGADTSLIDYGINPLAYEVQVDSAYLSIGRYFSTDLAKGSIINNLAPLSILAAFDPDADVEYTDTINLVTSIGIIKSVLRGRGKSGDFVQLNNILDFGRKQVGSTSDSIVAIGYNSSTNVLNITALPLFTQSPVIFGADLNQNSLQPGDTLFAYVSFTPSSAALYQNRLPFTIDGSTATYQLRISGEGVEAGLQLPDSILVSLPACSGEAQTEFDIELIGVSDSRIASLVVESDGIAEFAIQDSLLRDGVIKTIGMRYIGEGTGQGLIIVRLGNGLADTIRVFFKKGIISFIIEDIARPAPIGQNSSSTFTVEVRNIGDEDITWDYALPFDIGGGFELIDISPILLQPDSVSVFEIEFASGTVNGLFEQDFAFFSDCSDTLLADLRATVGSGFPLLEMKLTGSDTLWCGLPDTLSLLLINEGTEVLDVSEIVLPDGLEIIESGLPFSIEVGDSIEQGIYWSGSSSSIALGTNNIEFRVNSNSGGQIDEKSFSFNLFYSEELFEVPNGRTVRSIGTFLVPIRNLTSHDINIIYSYRLARIGEDTATVLSDISLDEWSTSDLSLLSDFGFLQGLMILEVNCQRDTILIDFDFDYGVEIVAKSIETESGLTENIEVDIKPASALPFPLTFTLRTNSTLLRKTDYTYSRFVNNIAEFELSIPQGIYSDTTLVLEYSTAWGNDSISRLEPDVAIVSGSGFDGIVLDKNIISGEALFLDICHADGGRFYGGGSSESATSFEVTIKEESLIFNFDGEDSEGKVVLANSIGQIVLEVGVSSNESIISTEKLSAGLYVYSIIIGGIRKSGVFVKGN